jgi:hypothetical protein
MLVRL